MVEKPAHRDGIQSAAQLPQVLVPGEKKPLKASAGWAAEASIGDIKVTNAFVRMTEDRIWGAEADGILGTDFFSEFRISIDPSKKAMRLEKLPDLPGDDPFAYDAPTATEPGFTK